MITQLADYPALKKLAEALWRQDTKRHGAAIMIGAGFSRCSASHVDGKRQLPLWRDLAAKLAEGLDREDKELAFSDPLRLAEEYRAYFGDAALNDLIKAELQDEAWIPGPNYTNLLALPWSEVLTTNWDTLLERSAPEVNYPIYGIVNKQADLASVSSPRIVKLHGTIGVSENFTFSQEDYRRYPIDHAAFVNFVRQVFIENELCLLGFSGDDPNFLQWAGWVRDHLANKARRIYLVGALRLNAAKRKFLESINIAPIDLWGAVEHIEDKDLIHKSATEVFLKTLAELMPKPTHEWEPTSLTPKSITADEHSHLISDAEVAAAKLENQLDLLRDDREKYPGWLVCPPDIRRRLENQIDHPYPNAKNIPAMRKDSRERLLYEIAWRHQTSMAPVAPWIINELEKIADPSVSCAISKQQQLEIALLLMRHYRQSRDFQNFERIASVLERHSILLLDCKAEVSYQRAISARDNFDYLGIERNLDGISGDDPIWRMRKASLLAELGRFSEGESLVADAYRDLLSRSRNDPSSISVASKLAWASWVLRIVNFLKNYEEDGNLRRSYTALRCDPRSQIEFLKEKAAKQQEQYLKDQEDIEPLFEKGHYRDNFNTVRFGGETPAIYLLSDLAERVGLPLTWDHMDVISSLAKQILLSGGVENGPEEIALAIRSANSEDSPIVKNLLSRREIANSSIEAVRDLAVKSKSAIKYWQKQAALPDEVLRRHAINKIRVHIEVLARLAVRLESEEATGIFKMSLELVRDKALSHRWLHDVLSHLANYSLSSVPDVHKVALLKDALSFPLPSEAGVHEAHFAARYPNPIIEHPPARVTDSELDTRLNQIIGLVSPGNPSGSIALLRLLPLVRAGFLKQDELNALAARIWGATPDYLSLPDTGLLSHALLSLPAPDKQKVADLFRRTVFGCSSSHFLTHANLSALTGAARLGKNSLFPTEDQARDCFDALASWRPKEGENDFLGFRASNNKEIMERAGEALASSIVPSLASQDIDEIRYKNLLSFYEETKSPAVIPAFPYFTNLGSDFSSAVEKIIRKGIHSRSSHEVGWSAEALLRWKRLSIEGKAEPAPSSLVSKIIYLIESGRTTGLHSLLHYAGEFLKSGWLSQADLDVLVESIPELFDAADYNEIKPNSPEAITASLVREACVKLAMQILKNSPSQKLEAMVSRAKQDALPEVRFA